MVGIAMLSGSGKSRFNIVKWGGVATADEPAASLVTNGPNGATFFGRMQEIAMEAIMQVSLERQLHIRARGPAHEFCLCCFTRLLAAVCVWRA
jgi:hypothetical protein